MNSRFYHIFFLLLILTAFFHTAISYSSEKKSSQPPMKEMLFKAISRLLENGSVSGKIVEIGDAWSGELQLDAVVDSSMREDINGNFSFEKDSVSGEFTLPCWGDTIRLSLAAELTEDNIKGSGSFYGRCIAGEFSLHSALDNEGDYDLYVTVKLDSLFLNGALEALQPRKAQFLRKMKNLADYLGFEDLILTIAGDSCLRYHGLEFECTASVNLSSRQPGMKTGTVQVKEGKIWKCGREFKLTQAFYDFASARLSAAAVLKTKVYVTSEDSGTVLRNYTVNLVYEGMIQDSLNCFLYSEPALNDDQIYALLIKRDPFAPEVSGKVASNIEETIKQAAWKYNSLKFTRYAERQVGRALAFDQVVIEGNVFSTGSQYRAFKGLTGRLKLSLRGTVGGSTDQTVSFDYKLGENIYLINETNQFGQTGLDLRYVIRFK